MQRISTINDYYQTIQMWQPNGHHIKRENVIEIVNCNLNTNQCVDRKLKKGCLRKQQQKDMNYFLDNETFSDRKGCAYRNHSSLFE